MTRRRRRTSAGVERRALPLRIAEEPIMRTLTDNLLRAVAHFALGCVC